MGLPPPIWLNHNERVACQMHSTDELMEICRNKQTPNKCEMIISSHGNPPNRMQEERFPPPLLGQPHFCAVFKGLKCFSQCDYPSGESSNCKKCLVFLPLMGEKKNVQVRSQFLQGASAGAALHRHQSAPAASPASGPGSCSLEADPEWPPSSAPHPCPHPCPKLLVSGQVGPPQGAQRLQGLTPPPPHSSAPHSSRTAAAGRPGRTPLVAKEESLGEKQPGEKEGQPAGPSTKSRRAHGG